MKSRKSTVAAKENRAEVIVEKQESKKETKKLNKLKLNLDSNSVHVLISPLITEKAAISESINKYCFKVAKWATKNQIKQAVKELYDILPIKVHVINVEGKKISTRRSSGKRSDYKKAMVTLPLGKTIDIHKGV